MKKRLTAILSIITFLLIVSCSAKEQKERNISDSKVIDWEYQIAYQRGIEAMNWAILAVSIMSMRKANFSLGGGYNTVYWMSKPPTALQEAITANNQTPYASINLSTKSGPVVLDVPPASKRTAIFGSAINVWQVPIADIGAAGSDKGKGGKYLFLPPGYEGEVSKGYIVVQRLHRGAYGYVRRFYCPAPYSIR